jgi:hypothetical protein
MRAVRYGYTANVLRPDIAVGGREVLPGALNLPGRFVGAVDAFSKPLSAHGELYAQAVIGAKRAGLKGRAYQDEVARLRIESTPEMRAAAADAADYRAFQAQSATSDWLTKQKNRGGIPALDLRCSSTRRPSRYRTSGKPVRPPGFPCWPPDAAGGRAGSVRSRRARLAWARPALVYEGYQH